MKTKISLIVFFLSITCSANAHVLMSLTPEQSNNLVQIIINIVSFLCGLFINPKKKENQ